MKDAIYSILYPIRIILYFVLWIVYIVHVVFVFLSKGAAPAFLATTAALVVFFFFLEPVSHYISVELLGFDKINDSHQYTTPMAVWAIVAAPTIIGGIILKGILGLFPPPYRPLWPRLSLKPPKHIIKTYKCSILVKPEEKSIYYSIFNKNLFQKSYKKVPREVRGLITNQPTGEILQEAMTKDQEPEK